MGPCCFGFLLAPLPPGCLLGSGTYGSGIDDVGNGLWVLRLAEAVVARRRRGEAHAEPFGHGAVGEAAVFGVADVDERVDGLDGGGGGQEGKECGGAHGEQKSGCDGAVVG